MKWIVTDIFKKVKLEVEAPNLDTAINIARTAYPRPEYAFDCAHVAETRPEWNEPYFTLLPLK